MFEILLYLQVVLYNYITGIEPTYFSIDSFYFFVWKKFIPLAHMLFAVPVCLLFHWLDLYGLKVAFQI